MERNINKILFIDRTSLPCSVVRIVAQNINLMNEDDLEVRVIHQKDFRRESLSNERVILVEPFISIEELILEKAIPPSIKIKSFSPLYYGSMNYEGIIDQINCLLA